ncbi:MAG: hypothetical protein LAN84_08270 [Acidobacteriia bacterium]|nr:hypothetical protein [Terriglobia bacterium]
MNIALRKAALPISLLVAGVCTVMYAGASAPQTAGQAAPAARNTPLCAFVKKVIAAAPEEFAPLQGEEDTLLGKDKHNMFHGTLALDADSQCTLHTRRGAQMENPPLYSCQLGPYRMLPDAKPVYEKAAAELRAAFPKWKFVEKKEGEESKREESWKLTAEQAGFTAELSLYDWGNLAEMVSGESSGRPGVMVLLDVSDTLPEKEKPKTAAAQEMTANLPLCKFIEKVRAARQDNYTALRSAKPAEASGAVAGTLRPDTQSICKVYPPHSGGNKQAFYLCELRRTKTMEEIKPEYERLKTELQGCYSNLRFDENINDSEGEHADIWFFSGKDALYQLTVEARDDGYMLKTDPEKVDVKTKQAPVSLRLQIQFLQ